MSISARTPKLFLAVLVAAYLTGQVTADCYLGQFLNPLGHCIECSSGKFCKYIPENETLCFQHCKENKPTSNSTNANSSSSTDITATTDEVTESTESPPSSSYGPNTTFNSTIVSNMTNLPEKKSPHVNNKAAAIAVPVGLILPAICIGIILSLKYPDRLAALYARMKCSRKSQPGSQPQNYQHCHQQEDENNDNIV